MSLYTYVHVHVPGECSQWQMVLHVAYFEQINNEKRVLPKQYGLYILAVIYTVVHVSLFSFADVKSLATDLLSKWMAIFKEGQAGIYTAIPTFNSHGKMCTCTCRCVKLPSFTLLALLHAQVLCPKMCMYRCIRELVDYVKMVQTG